MSIPAIPMLLSTINCSISDEKKHLKLDELIDLVKHLDEKKTSLSPIQKYAIGMIQTEASNEEIKFFVKNYNVNQREMNNVLSFKPYAS